jgi:hypothetical protein
VPKPPPQLVSADHLELCDMPVPLQENPNDSPAPHALPLILPVNAAMKPRPADPFADNIKLAAAGSGEFHPK